MEKFRRPPLAQRPHEPGIDAQSPSPVSDENRMG
jgi:hypothetical protein